MKTNFSCKLIHGFALLAGLLGSSANLHSQFLEFSKSDFSDLDYFAIAQRGAESVGLSWKPGTPRSVDPRILTYLDFFGPDQLSAPGWRDGVGGSNAEDLLNSDRIMIGEHFFEARGGGDAPLAFRGVVLFWEY